MCTVLLCLLAKVQAQESQSIYFIKFIKYILYKFPSLGLFKVLLVFGGGFLSQLRLLLLIHQFIVQVPHCNGTPGDITMKTESTNPGLPQANSKPLGQKDDC